MHLDRYMVINKIKNRKMAHLVKCDPSTISKYRSGTRKPDSTRGLMIEKVTKGIVRLQHMIKFWESKQHEREQRGVAREIKMNLNIK